MYRVFLVDDEPWTLIGIERLVEWGKFGFCISGKATSGRQAWNEIQSTRPDVVLTDIRMPGLDGLNLIRLIRENEIDVSVIFISGFAEFEYAKEAIRHGAFDYLVKQVNGDQLIDCLKRLKEYLDKKKSECSEIECIMRDSSVEVSCDPLFRKAEKYIDKHFADNVSAAGVADFLGISQGYLSRIIKKETGKTYSEMVMERKIFKSKELLRYTNETISRIAEKSGFSDYYYFAKTFKRITGQSPKEYRKNAVKNR